MLTPYELFRIRLKRNRKEQARAWNSVFDWSVWVYILIPVVLIGGGLYRDVWLDMPKWASSVPWTVLYPIVLFVMMIVLGRMRIFVDEADRLFMLQRPEWLGLLKRYGMIYSFAKWMLVLAVPYGILLPFLVYAEEMRAAELISSYLFTGVYGGMVGMSMLLFPVKLRGWRKVMLETITLLVLGAGYLVSMIGLEPGTSSFAPMWLTLALLIPTLLTACLKQRIDFEAEVKNERSARMATTELLMSQVMEKKSFARTKRPLLLRRSQRLFRRWDDRTMLAELRLVAFARSMTQLRVWLGFLSVTTVASTLVPPSASYVLIVGFLYLGLSWLRMQWNQWFEEEFIKQFPWNPVAIDGAIRLSRFWLMVPHLAVWSAVAGFRVGGIGIALLSIACILAVWWVYSLRGWRVR